MTVYEVWEQWPCYPVVSFKRLADAVDFIKTDGWRFALPIVVSRTCSDR